MGKETKEAIEYWLNKIEIISKILLPVVLLLLGCMLNNSYRAKEQQLKQVELNQQFIQKQVELNQKYIEIAVGILNSKPTPETIPLRDWAIDIIDKYSEIKLSKEAKKLLKVKPLSKVQYLTDEKGNNITDEKGNRLILN
jgi:hypothetical protein